MSDNTITKNVIFAAVFIYSLLYLVLTICAVTPPNESGNGGMNGVATTGEIDGQAVFLDWQNDKEDASIDEVLQSLPENSSTITLEE